MSLCKGEACNVYNTFVGQHCFLFKSLSEKKKKKRKRDETEEEVKEQLTPVEPAAMETTAEADGVTPKKKKKSRKSLEVN